MRAEVMDTVDRQLGAIARPGAVHFVTLLPKTRSGKLLRRAIQALAEGRDPGDLTTIEDPAALEQIRGRCVASAARPAAATGVRASESQQSRRGVAVSAIVAVLGKNTVTRKIDRFSEASRVQHFHPRAARRAAARCARPRDARRRDRQHALRIGRGRRRRRAHCCIAAGDPSFVTMTRSALKPLQAVPLVAGRRRRALRILERSR